MGFQVITNNDHLKIKSQVFKSVICKLILEVLQWKFTRFYFLPFTWPNTGFYAFSFSSGSLTSFPDNVNNSNQSSDCTVSLSVLHHRRWALLPTLDQVLSFEQMAPLNTSACSSVIQYTWTDIMLFQRRIYSHWSSGRREVLKPFHLPSVLVFGPWQLWTQQMVVSD